MPIKKGDIIKMKYIGKLEDGTIFEAIDENNTIKFQVGNGEILKALDKAVIGMEKGEERDIKVAPQKSYGIKDPKLIKKLDRNIFPENIEVDTTFFLNDEEGNEIPGRIIDISKDKVVIDLNHPLAGKRLNFFIKILDVMGDRSGNGKNE